MFKKIICVGAAVSLVAVAALFADGGNADVIVKYTGPSGQGDVVWIAADGSKTNLILSKIGIKLIEGNGAGLTNVTGTASPNGTTLNALNLTACTNLPAAGVTVGGTFGAINGSALTALGAANIAAGGSISAINGAAITNINPANISGTVVSGIITNAGTGYTNLWTFTNGRLTAYSATGTMP